RSVRFFSDRDIEVVDKGDDVEVVYRYNARSLLNLIGLDAGENGAPKDEREKKVHQILDDARRASSARFTLKMPGKVSATSGEKADEKGARWKIDKSNAKAQDALLKEPLRMSVTLAKKDAAFWEKEKERKKTAEESKAPAPEATPRPKKPGGGLGDD